MTFGDSIKTCLSKYATFQGRASRSEYWWFQLFILLGYAAVAMIGSGLGGFRTGLAVAEVAGLFVFLPSIGVLVRRLHDTNRSGWWYWITLVPLIGGILLLVWFCSQGTRGPNDYGDDPLSGGYADVFR